ncbi:hypothetical protein WMF31_28355 [Sorangium sp. So ce1036]|uniref:hypothetical protein n=1 Tax=Sorangium sp. So ce1036 TaxID=3133328 RepID=UPI003F0709FF
MSLTLLAAAAAAVAATVGYLASRRDREAEGATGEEALRAASGAPGGAPWDELPFALGDVVLVGSEERWLAGALVARERGELVAVVFLAPEGAAQGAVVTFPEPRREILWLLPAEVDAPDEPPATLEIAGMTLRRRARLPVTLERVGQGAPPLGDAGIIALYEGGGHDAAVVLASEGRIHAWSGRRIDGAGYERLGGGGEG